MIRRPPRSTLDRSSAASDVYKRQSLPSLAGLAQLLVSKPNYGLKIEGHTDNVGKADMNQELSRKRAEAVKKFLASKGVVADKLETAGSVSYTHLRAHETVLDLVCRLLLEKKKKTT